jgi:hypothetical protein
MAALCFDGDGMRAAEPLLTKLVGTPMLANPDSDGLGNRLRENEPRGAIAAPLLIVQGMADEMVSPEITGRFVQERCLAGQNLDYWMFVGLEHGTMDSSGSKVGTELVRWTQDRLEGRAQKAGCQRKQIAR